MFLDQLVQWDRHRKQLKQTALSWALSWENMGRSMHGGEQPCYGHWHTSTRVSQDRSCRLSLIRTLNIVWVMTACEIITSKCLINSDGTLRRGLTLKFYLLSLFMREDYSCLKAKTFPITTDCYTVIILGTIKLAHQFWWNFDEMNFSGNIFPSLDVNERCRKECIGYYIILYPVIWNANDEQCILIREIKGTIIFVPFTVSMTGRYGEMNEWLIHAGCTPQEKVGVQ